MRRHVFVRIMNVVEEHDDYFIQEGCSWYDRTIMLAKGGSDISYDT
jgi:hypothetical protein